MLVPIRPADGNCCRFHSGRPGSGQQRQARVLATLPATCAYL